MKKEFSLTIRFEGAAFAPPENPDLVVAEMLEQVAQKVLHEGLRDKTQSIRDYNGNRVGSWVVAETEQ